MNFLFFSAQYLPHMGGVENFTYNISRELIEIGHTVTVVASNTTNSKSREDMDNISVYRLDCYNFIDGRYPIFKRNKQYKETISTLNQFNFDLVVVNARFYFHSILGAKYAYKRKIPCITIDHGTSHLTVHNRILDFVGGYYEHFITHILKKYCSNFYGVSKASSLWLKHFNITSKGEIYNAIDIKKIRTILDKNSASSFRKKEDIPTHATVLAFTGRLLKEKGIIQLVASVEKWNDEHRTAPIYLCLAGEGPLKTYLIEHSNEFVHYLGRLNFEQIIYFLRESDIFVLPSDSEGFSTSLLEAAACRNFIVTTLRGGAKELLPDDTYGIVIDHNDLDSVYNAIETAIKYQNRDEAEEKTYNRVINNFTWEISTNTILSVIQEIKI